MGRIEGKRALVTGAASGIGRAAAIRFAAEGARVACIDVDGDALAEVVGEIGDAASGYTADVADDDRMRAVVEEAEGALGGMDVIVANAAIQLFGEGGDARVTDLDPDVWDRTVRVNLRGVYVTCRHGIAALLRQGGGSVICTASPTGLFGLAPGFDAYSASKAGVYGLVRVMANDYGRDNVRVNAVIPGFTDTPLVTEAMQDDEWREGLCSTIPLRRPGTPEEVASMMLFLASDEASYATGGAFCVDGGMTAV